MLIGIPDGGLTNRLRLLASAERIARVLDQPFALHWVRNRQCGCAFNDLFTNDITLVGEEELPDEKRTHVYKDGKADDYTASHLMVMNSIKRLHELPNIVIRSCWFVAFVDECVRDEESTLPEYFRKEMAEYHMMLEPVQEVRFEVERFSASFDQHTVGVHIRRADHIDARRESPNDRFVNRLQELMNMNPATNFFLATDCVSTERYFMERFGDRIRVYPKHYERSKGHGLALDRGTREGMMGALVDLLLLARVRRVVGSAGSTFSRAAEYFSGHFGKVTLVGE